MKMTKDTQMRVLDGIGWTLEAIALAGVLLVIWTDVSWWRVLLTALIIALLGGFALAKMENEAKAQYREIKDEQVHTKADLRAFREDMATIYRAWLARERENHDRGCTCFACEIRHVMEREGKILERRSD